MLCGIRTPNDDIGNEELELQEQILSSNYATGSCVTFSE